MTERETVERAREDARGGKSRSTQAGEFVREEIHHVREGDGCPQKRGATRGLSPSALQTNAFRFAPTRSKCPARLGDEGRQNQGKKQSKPSSAKNRASPPGAYPEDRRRCMKLEACAVALIFAGFALASEHSQPATTVAGRRLGNKHQLNYAEAGGPGRGRPCRPDPCVPERVYRAIQ
jgi:hypothetical protein